MANMYFLTGTFWVELLNCIFKMEKKMKLSYSLVIQSLRFYLDISREIAPMPPEAVFQFLKDIFHVGHSKFSFFFFSGQIILF